MPPDITKSILLLLLLTASCKGAAFTSFTAKGKFLLEQPAQGIRRKIGFDVSLRGGQWFIHYREGDKQGFYGADGTNVFSYFLDPHPQTPDGKPISFVNGVRNLAHAGMAQSVSYPFYGSVFCKLPWLAYCSGGFLATNLSNLPATWCDPLNDPAAVIFRSEATFLDDGAGLPSTVMFRVSANRKRNALTNAVLAIQRSELFLKRADRLKEYQDGLLVAEYRVRTTTNFQGVTLPLSFELTRFTEENSRVLERFRAVVTNIEPCRRTSFLPRIPETGVSVADFRFKDSHIDGIEYILRRSAWPDVNDPALRRIYDKTLQRRGVVNARAIGWPRAIAVTLIAMLFTIPLLFWAIRKAVLAGRSGACSNL